MAADQRYKRHVSKAWPGHSDLMAVAETVESLRAHPGWQALQVILEAEAELVNDELDRTGEPPSQAHYAQAHGRRDGMRAAVNALDAILEVAEKANAEQERKHNPPDGESSDERS